MINGTGYTEDGKVWLQILGTYQPEDSKEALPVQVVEEMTPEIARKLATHLEEAAQKAEGKPNAMQKGKEEEEKA